MQPNSRLNEARIHESALLVLLLAVGPLFAQAGPPAGGENLLQSSAPGVTQAAQTTAETTAALQISVPSGKHTQVPTLDTTSAVSLDLHIAEVSLDSGLLTIKGVDPGDTIVVAMGENGLRKISVHVSPGPPMYPPGFIPPHNSGNDNGSYEFRYSSDRQQFENIIDLSSQNAAGETTQLHFVSATYAGEPKPTTFVPSAYYRIATRDTDLTLLDQTVNESPLTLQNVVVRGVHIRDGDWRFHAGYTTSADFADVFIPTEKEFAAGVSHTTALESFLSITPGIYFLRSIDLANGEQRSAFIGSLFFNADFSPTWHLKAEAADGRGLAYAGELHHESDRSKLHARIMDRKLDFPALRTSALPGLNGDASWTQFLTSRLSLFSGASVNNVDLNRIQQDSQSAFTNLRLKLSPAWSLGTGANYGAFTTVGAFSAKTLTLPQQINYDQSHFGVGFQYEFASASDSFSNGSGLRQTARMNWGRFQIGEYVDLQKDALSVSALFSQLPALQQELQKLGITAVTPEQLALLLQEAAFLQSLGLASTAQIVTVPRRLQEGGNLTWSSSGPRPHQLSLSLIADHNQFTTYNSRDYNLTGAYSKQISNSNQVQVSWSVIDSDITGRQILSPLVSASFRHTFSRAPVMSWKQENTVINGVVFIDSTRRGSYEAGMETISKAIVILDGERATSTDSAGLFRFSGVCAGNHRIQLQYKSPREHYFTSPQDTVVAGGASVNFGIAFPKTDLWGYVEDDTGNGLANVKLQITGTFGEHSAITDTAGKFILPDVQPGNYRLEVDPESVAFGYSMENLVAAEVSVTAASFTHPVLKIPAVRVLIGTVTVYDPVAQNYVPVKDAEVSIPRLDRFATTNAAGRFTLAGLPAGDLEIKLVAGQSSLTHTINMPVRPATLRNDFTISSLTGEIAATVASGTK